jgi:RNA ligase
MHKVKTVDTALLKKMVDEKLVSVQKHPTSELFIYNYSAKVQYDKLWNEVTLQTRGLIMDREMKVVARPFGKFFNIEEHQPHEIPNLPFDVFEKLDGSLGILYWIDDKPFMATRGSFESQQSKHATELLHGKYAHTFDKLNRHKTYLFEIIYPQNRIVIDYGAMDDLVLLTVVDTWTGEESIEHIGFPLVKRFDGIKDLQHLKTWEEENKEGFVIRFQNGFRVKMKFAEYIRLHHIVTGVSNVTVWEYLRDGKPFDELIDKVPDEFNAWLMETSNKLEMDFNAIHDDAQARYKKLFHEDKKTFAVKVMDEASEISAILFNMYTGKKVEPLIWKRIRPTFSRAFK